MRCSKCGSKIKKNSSFCIKCGAKIPPPAPKAKKQKRNKKGSKAKIIIPVILIFTIALFSFLVFGGDKVPGPIKNLKAYSYVTGVIHDKLPDKLPFSDKKLPFNFSFKLPDIPNPVEGILGSKEVPKKDEIMEDLKSFGEEGKDKIEFDSLEIEKRITVEEEKKDTIFVITETSNDTGSINNYYKLIYKKHVIGGWKLDSVNPYNVPGEKTSVAGVGNKKVADDPNLFADIPSEWKHSKVRVVEHFTDVKAGTDTVVVYMELKNDYVYMTGTKEIVYQYNDSTGKWESVGPASKLTCLSIKPVNNPSTEQDTDETKTTESGVTDQQGGSQVE